MILPFQLKWTDQSNPEQSCPRLKVFIGFDSYIWNATNLFGSKLGFSILTFIYLFVDNIALKHFFKKKK